MSKEELKIDNLNDVTGGGATKSFSVSLSLDTSKLYLSRTSNRVAAKIRSVSVEKGTVTYVECHRSKDNEPFTSSLNSKTVPYLDFLALFGEVYNS